MRDTLVLILKNLVFTLICPGTAAVYVPLLLSHGRTPVTPLTLAVSLVFFAAGTAIYLWCLWHFAFFGRGTPSAIDAPKKLVVRGLYKYIRNPMYVGVLTAILGWGILYRSGTLLGYAALLWICFQLFIVFYEEAHLRKIFGSEYDEYCTRVNRWLPKFTK